MRDIGQLHDDWPVGRLTNSFVRCVFRKKVDANVDSSNVIPRYHASKHKPGILAL